MSKKKKNDPQKNGNNVTIELSLTEPPMEEQIKLRGDNEKRNKKKVQKDNKML